MSQNVLHVENVTMQFGGVVAVNNLSMDINEACGINGIGQIVFKRPVFCGRHRVCLSELIHVFHPLRRTCRNRTLQVAPCCVCKAVHRRISTTYPG